MADLKFMAWKLAELVTYVIAWPFLFVGAWGYEASEWCHDRALRHRHPPRI